MILDPLRACDVAVRWSARVADLDLGDLDSLAADEALPTASVGKLFLLATVAAQIDDGTIDPGEELEPAAQDRVGDSGLLQHLRRQRLPVADLAALVGAVSDNLATNVLLRRVGLRAVGDVTTRLGIADSALDDFVRDERRAGLHAPTLSHGTAADLSAMVERIERGTLLSEAVARRVRDWLTRNVDLSMVASAFALDPLAHGAADTGGVITLFNKTGSDAGTRADVGVVGAGRRRIAYAVIARWDGDDLVSRTAVLESMRGVGEAMRQRLLAG